MTKETVEKLDGKFKTYLENRKALLHVTKYQDEVRLEIRAYLEALKDCGQISQTECRVLFTYYTL